MLIRIRMWILNHFFKPSPLRNRGFGGFLTMSHTVTRLFLRNLAKWLTPTRQWIHNISGTIRYTSGSGSGLMQKSGFESRITFGWHFGLDGGCALWVFLFYYCRGFESAVGTADSRLISTFDIRTCIYFVILSRGVRGVTWRRILDTYNLITLRLDYYNSVLAGLPQSTLEPLGLSEGAERRSSACVWLA